MLRARHRMRSVATLTSGGRLPLRSLELVLLTLAELVVGLFTGRLGEAWASLRAFVGLRAADAEPLARRRGVAKLRRVDDSRDPAAAEPRQRRLTRYRRARDTETYIGTRPRSDAGGRARSVRRSPGSLVLVFIVLASRTMFDHKVPTVGEFLPLPASPAAWWSDFASAWNPGGLGATVANPRVGRAVDRQRAVAVPQGLGLTVLVVGLLILGVWGAWRSAPCSVEPGPHRRPRCLRGAAARAGVMSTAGSRARRLRRGAVVRAPAAGGRRHRHRRSRRRPTTSSTACSTLAARPVRRTAMLALAVALAVALAPAVLPILVLVTIVLALTSLAAGAGLRTRAGWPASGSPACAVAWVLNLPWSTTWSWDDLVRTVAGAPGRGLADVAAMAIGRGRFELLSLALYVPVLTALLVCRAWRLTWAARAAGLVVVFLLLAVLQDRDSLPFRVPEVGLLLVPLGLGMAISAAAAIAAFGEDVAERTFGWRQPLGLLGLAAVAVGVAPALFTLTDGAWYGAAGQLDRGGRGALAAGDVGRRLPRAVPRRPRLIPFPSIDLGDGVAMALIDDDRTDLRDRWAVADQAADETLREAVHQIADGATPRRPAAGAVRHPFRRRAGDRRGVIDDDETSAGARWSGRGVRGPARPRPPTGPAELCALRQRERDARRRSAHRAAGGRIQGESVEDLAGVDTSTATAVFPQVDQTLAATADVNAGVVNLATPHESQWRLSTAARRGVVPVVRRRDPVRRGDGRLRRAALRPAGVADAVARRARPAAGGGAGGGQSSYDPGAAAHEAGGRAGADQSRRRAGGGAARRRSHRLRWLGR